MKKNKLIALVVSILLIMSLFACSSNSSATEEKQPNFPTLGEYWVIDPYGYVEQDTIEAADQIFEKLRQDQIAEVAIIIQKDVKDNGPMDDELIWARDWGRNAKLGDENDQRSIVWLIRPDVDSNENRVTIEISTNLTWLTVGDYYPILEEAAKYANADDFNGAVESITRNTDEILRSLWEEKNN